MTNYTIVNPNKEVVALIKWLLDNTCKEKDRPSLTHIKLEEKGICWATNGFAMVRAQVFSDLIEFEPGVYEVISCTNKLLHMIGQDINYPNVLAVYEGGRVDPLDCKLAAFDPKFLGPIIKPFETVYIHTSRSMKMSIALKESSTLPFGKYTAILMAKAYKQAYEEINDFFPAPDPVLIPAEVSAEPVAE